jgi:uncharacterized protein YjbI with pentapeptide repeats
METESNRVLNGEDGSSPSWLGSSEEILDGAKLSGQDINNKISFENCRLRNADFSHAKLDGANFSGATLGNPSEGSDFGADFSKANLKDSDFSYSNLRGANFSDADLDNADLTQLDADASFSSDHKEGAKFSNAKLPNADLSRSDFSGADFSDADFSSNVHEITAVWGPGVYPSDDDEDDPDFENTVFVAADFSGADIRRLEISGSNFRRADLSEVILWGTTFSEAIMDYAILSEADIRFGDLSGSSLSGADLTNAVLEETNLSDVDFQGATLDHVSFKDNDLDGIVINEETSFAPPSRWELRADADAETGIFENWGIRRLRALNRSASDVEHLQSAEIQYRLLQRLQREHDLTPSLDISVYEKHAKRKRALAEKNYIQWISIASSRWILGYGLLLRPVIGTMIGVILVLGLLYPALGFQDATTTPVLGNPQIIRYDSVPPNLSYQTGVDILHGLYLSAITFSTLGYGDISPTGSARVLAVIESFIGGLLMAFLVFVLGRRISY